ncbi:probable inactive poly [ADP-ribose] polymerase SRO3 isoform X2 [Elaeis guineensis]|uniref:Probable inactive poly [ADP-ribose] polymerase SRO3 isoform X2 n=1 Tax=Elaeis guineensis var. tenera TaxID=51953 RepID=A0A6I9S8P0_ELAGV|nr:probable inactive poly [ADP-ribose] polymerase SRO3 isoform X2 [Elaeis guineensis]
MKLTNPGFSIPIARKEASPIADLTARIVDSNGNELASKKSSPSGIENCQPGASSLQRSNFSPDPSSCTGLNQDFKNFRKSSTPSRFLFFCDDSWTDFPYEVFNILRAGFVAGTAILEVTVDNCSYIFDFQRMIQIDMRTGISNSIAWIDINGQCFFPRVVVDRQRNIIIDKRPSDCNNSLKRKRDEFEMIEEHSDESPEPSNAATFDRPRWTGVEVLGDGDRYYKVVEKLFLDGMRKFAPETVITSIHKCLHSSPSGNSRLKAFQIQMQMTKANRGDDNVKFGWYGTSARDVAAVISHGFGQPNNSTLGSDACGVGIHLSPPHSPFASSLLSEVDANGERHVILCRVIMGRSEKVEAGSLQFHPSSEDFDSGVDDLENPKWYILWSTCMNTRILPEYVVSFKSSKQSQDMGRSLSSSQRQDIEISYDHYKAGKMSKDTFIKHLRSTAGDKLLASIIRRIRGY